MKKLVFALIFAGMVFLSGCLDEIPMDGARKEVGIYGAQFSAYTTDDLKAIVEGECKHTCTGMDYEYRYNRYTVYEEGGLYFARDPKCICHDPNYGIPLPPKD